MNFHIRIPIAVAIDYGPILFHALEPLVALIHIVAATGRCAQAPRNDAGVDACAVVGGLLSLQKFGQPTGVVGKCSLAAHIATHRVGVDVGLLYHIDTNLVAQVVEPHRLGIAYADGVVALLFEVFDVGLGLLTHGGSIVGHGA